jgi:hypothetical protein
MHGATTNAESAMLWTPTAVSAVGGWEIRNFSLFNSDKGYSVTSNTLCEAAGARFALMLYPGGHEDQYDQVRNQKRSSIYVQATCRHNVMVSFKITIISADGEGLHVAIDEEILWKTHYGEVRGFHEFLLYSQLCGIAKENNDVLQLRLEIRAWHVQPVVQEEPGRSSFAEDWMRMLAEGTGVDVTLQVVGDHPETLEAHRSVLAARSPVFKQMFFPSGPAEPATTAEVKLVDVEPKTVSWFLHFLYTNEIHAEISGEEEALCNLLAIGQKYQVQDLVQRVEEKQRQQQQEKHRQQQQEELQHSSSSSISNMNAYGCPM